MNRSAPLLIAVVVNLVFLVVPALAQFQSADISNVYEISDKDAADGDILITTKDQGIIRASQPNDVRLFGILSESLLVYRRIDNQGKPIVRNGMVQVNVTTLGGNIKAGDYITSSEIAGKGEKSTQSGYVLGIALNNLDEKNGTALNYQPKAEAGQPTVAPQKIYSGKVNVALKIEYAEIDMARNPNRLINSLNTAFFQNIQDPTRFLQVVRYITAAVTVLVGFGLGFYTFSRSIPKGIEAIGRNPLAEKAITFSIILNIFFTILTASVGIIAAAFILRL